MIEDIFTLKMMIVFTILLLLGLSGFYFAMRNTIEKDSEKQTLNTIQSLAKHKNVMLTNTINGWYLYAETIADLCIDVNDEFSAANIEKFDKSKTPYIIIFDQMGTVILGEKLNDSINQYMYYNKVMSGKRTVVSLVVKELENSKGLYVAVAVPIISSENTVIGGVLCAYKMSEISGILQNSVTLGISNATGTGDTADTETTVGAVDTAEIGDTIIIDQNGQIITGSRANNSEKSFFDLPKGDNFFLDEDKKSKVRMEIEQGKSDFVQVGAGQNNGLIVYEHNLTSEWTVVTMVDRMALEAFSYNIPKNLLYILGGGITFIGIMYMLVFLMYITIIRISHEKSEILKAEKNELEDIVMRDPMTGLYNKKTAMEMMKNSLRGTNKTKKHALLFIDIDNFKTINDDYGHEKGDELILLFAEIMKRHFRKDDILARFGGDEFIILVKNYGDEQALRQRAESLCSLIVEETKNRTEHSISISIGIAIYPEHGNTYEELIRNADKALYWSKNEGKSQYHMYNSNMKFLGQ